MNQAHDERVGNFPVRRAEHDLLVKVGNAIG